MIFNTDCSKKNYFNFCSLLQLLRISQHSPRPLAGFTGTYTSKGKEMREMGLRGGDSIGPRSGPPNFSCPWQYAQWNFRTKYFSDLTKIMLPPWCLDFAVEITPISITAGASLQAPTELATLSKASHSANWVSWFRHWPTFAVGFGTHFSSWFPSIWRFSLPWATDWKLRRHFVFTSYNII